MAQGRDFSTIRGILQTLFQNRGWEGKLQKYSFFKDWESIVGPQMAKQTTPHAWHKDILTVKVANSTWMQELKMMEGEILEKIRSHHPEIQIKRIRWEI